MRPATRRTLPIALTTLALALAALAAPAPAAAHPLGNFSVNSYCRIEPSAGGVRLRYALDMAEIPTFQERAALDPDGDGATSPAELAGFADALAARLADGLSLSAGGRRLPLTAGERSAELRPGQGGLQTLYLRLELTAPLPEGAGPWELAFSDPVFGGRPGWREVVVRAADGARLLASSAPAEDLSRELTAYPEDLLLAPLASEGAQFSFALGAGPAAGGPAPAATGAPTPLAPAPAGGPAPLAGALLAALLLGAGHALTPGHGKTIVAAYLVGARGTVRHALFLGLTTTVTHTAGVFALGLATLLFSAWVLPERLYPWLGAISGATVMLIGATLLRQRLGALLARGAARPGHGGDLDAHGGHDHGLGYHTHAPQDSAVSWGGLLALGVSGGLLPCPSALVLLLGAVALGQPGLGLLLVLSFSLGLAGVLTAIGVLLVRARPLFARLPGGGRLLPGISLAGAAVVVVAGGAITLQALAQAGLLS